MSKRRAFAALATLTLTAAALVAAQPVPPAPPDLVPAAVVSLDLTAEEVRELRADRQERARNLASRAQRVKEANQRASRTPASQPAATPAKPAVPKPPKRKPQPPVQASGNLAAVLSYARAQVGRPYRYATAGPSSFDCSGLVRASYLRIGISLPHQTGALAGRGRAVARAQLQPGDLVFPGSGHVGIYVGGGMMVHASNSAPYPRGGVKLSSVYKFGFARRIVG